jgi:hypothetical protein
LRISAATCIGVGTSILPGPPGFLISTGFCSGLSFVIQGVRDLNPGFFAATSTSIE